MTGFSVLFRNEGGKGIVAEIVTNKEPFLWKGDFKKEYTVTTGGARPQPGASRRSSRQRLSFRHWEERSDEAIHPRALPRTRQAFRPRAVLTPCSPIV